MLSKLKQTTEGRHIISLFSVVISAFMLVFAMQTFVKPLHLMPGGFLGVATLITELFKLKGINFPIYAGLIALNVPVALMCVKGISLRFTLYSIGHVFLTSFLLGILKFQPIFNDTLLNLIFGGFIYGFSITIALRGNASTGGTDFIALYISNKTGKSIWNQVFFGNAIMLTTYGYIFGWEYAGLSMLFQFMSTRTISTLHQRYDRVTLQITTTKADQVIEGYIKNFRHGISCIDAKGGYSGKPMYLLHTVISTYEQQDVICLLKEIDPKIIINIFRTQEFVGSFYNKPIE